MNQAAGAREFDLYLREGEQRLFWRLKNSGASIWSDGLTWEYDGEPRRRKFSEVVAVHLSSGHVARHGHVYTCLIRFADGSSLTLQSTTDMGLPDAAREPVYGDFVRLLHAQLAKSGAQGISYRAGMSEAKHRFGIAVMVIASLFFVVLPVGLFLFLEASWKLFGIIAVGAGMTWPIWQQISNNAPRDYSPDDLPHELLP